jgi:hypothetical protein
VIGVTLSSLLATLFLAAFVAVGVVAAKASVESFVGTGGAIGSPLGTIAIFTSVAKAETNFLALSFSCHL